MKKVFITMLSVCFLMVGLSAQNGKKIKKEVAVKFEITEATSKENPMIAMIKGSTMDMIYAPKKARVALNMMSGMMTTDVIVKGEDDMVMLMSAMGQKIKVVPTKEELAKTKADEAKKSKPNVKEFKEDKKEILGYDCYRVEVKDEGQVVEMYITDKIKVEKIGAGKQAMFADLVDGFPLEFKVDTKGTVMVFQAKEIEDKVTKEDFQYDDTGYKEMTMSELEQMGGQGF